jgi:hypothetical protein
MAFDRLNGAHQGLSRSFSGEIAGISYRVRGAARRTTGANPMITASGC